MSPSSVPPFLIMGDKAKDFEGEQKEKEKEEKDERIQMAEEKKEDALRKWRIQTFRRRLLNDRWEEPRRRMGRGRRGRR